MSAHGRPCRKFAIPAPPLAVVKVEDDPHGNPDRVEVTDGRGHHANMTVKAYFATCRLLPGAQVLTTNVLASA